jgi:glycerol-3-phosphate O-acyltransferase
MRIEDRERAVAEVTCRVVAETVAEASARGRAVDDWLRDAVYEERRRLERGGDGSDADDRRFIEGVRHRLLHAGEEERKALLHQVVERFAGEIAGNFDPRVYKFATSVVPHALALLLNALSPRRLFERFPHLPSLSTNVNVRGETQTIKRLADMGTLILCPTHLSNLDSPVIGWALHHVGLPPFLYGAGLNLFTNPLISFFMHNLGAYKVDRKKRAALYKEALKQYCAVSLEFGYHNLFFPGGTRSRSGGVERHLKLGLLGCGLRAYIENLRKGVERPNIWVVPATISYGLVLEAETLVDDYLKDMGRARYIIEDDESSRLSRVASFMAGVVGMDSRIYVTYGQPLDLFGNRVEADGRSYDQRGREIETPRYVLRGDEPVHDPQRDAEYTRELGASLQAALFRDNVLQATHLACFTLFELLWSRAADPDLYRLLRTQPELTRLPSTEVLEALQRVLEKVRALSDASRVRLDPRLRSASADQVLGDALRMLATYHPRAVIERMGDRVGSGDLNLLFYYHNRASGYDLEPVVAGDAVKIDLSRRPTGEPLVPRTEPPPRIQHPVPSGTEELVA